MAPHLKPGILFVVSGPSGVGKGTIRSKIFERKDHNLTYSISATTRKPRKNEKDGIDYYFKTYEEFEKLIEDGEFIEYAKFVDNYYGTPKKYVEEKLNSGEHVLLEIEVQGAEQIRKVFPNAVFIFIAPPNIKTLRKRLEQRGTDNKNTIARRVLTAIKELFLMSHYDYTIVNDKIDKAVLEILTIVKAEELKTKYIDKYILDVIAKDLEINERR